ncbi:hypothetical protein MB46_04510 [Arthrobacter alpinus]|uniref:FAD-dependent oxidoreductase n=1 Tax=Arthrobacter alpinus TaxID=656366 RepID=UPI0005C93CAB|nr:FAD-dependent oxidoreductase [Arthrobacter alpinus]ALV44879.1 hypothetical protein MB46_04510 [Arthrobacter alpinus]
MRGKAAIIGAGIAGLAAARALALRGWDVEVCESAPGLPKTGTFLGMWPEALKALDAIGVGEQVRQSGSSLGASADTGLRTPAGRTLVSVPGGNNLVMVSRPRLLEILADGVDVTFDSEATATEGFSDADAIIGADGTFSKTRMSMFGASSGPRSLGVVAWRGTATGAVSSHGETWAPGAMFGLTPAGPDATNWYACLKAGGRFEPPHLQHLRDLFGSWRTGPAEVLRLVEESEILHHELFEIPKIPSYFSGCVVLVGDAAHSMGPFLGRGACEALIDGVTLGRCLGEATSVEDGLAAYDRARRAKTQRLISMSRIMGQTAMMPHGFQGRNAVVGVAGSVMRAAGAVRQTLWH